MPRLEMVIFDLDDTLVCTAEMELYARKSALQSLGLPMDIERAVNIWRRLTWYFDADDVVSILKLIQIEMIGRVAAEISTIQVAANEYEERFWDSLQASPGAADLLAIICSEGALISILSNGNRAHQLRKLYITKLANHFDLDLVLIAPSGSALSKPRPDGLLQLLEHTQVAPENAIYVGDRKSDHIAAHLAGLAAAVGYTGESIEANEPSEPHTSLETPDFTIRTLNELLHIVEVIEEGKIAPAYMHKQS